MPAGSFALAAAALFTGAALYINVAEHPARMTLDDAGALAQWRLSYARGFSMQASLALASTLLGLLAFWQTGRMAWFIGACAIFINWPYTLIVILPVNKRLLATETSNADSHRLIEFWARLHAIRTVLGAVAVAAFLWATVA